MAGIVALKAKEFPQANRRDAHSMYAANVVEGNWKARTNIDAVGR